MSFGTRESILTQLIQYSCNFGPIAKFNDYQLIQSDEKLLQRIEHARHVHPSATNCCKLAAEGKFT